jgi:hypothetical protein
MKPKFGGESIDPRMAAVIQDQADIRAVVTDLVSTAPGRTFLWELLRIGVWGTQPFAGAPEHTAFNCGQLNVGQQIFALIAETAPDGLILMMKERKDAGRTDSAAASPADAGTGTHALADDPDDT